MSDLERHAGDFRPEADYYANLGVGRTATPAQIKAAFRRLSKAHHPDKNPGDASAEARYKLIVEAYEVLSDSTRRREYDQTGKRGERTANDYERVAGVIYEVLTGEKNIFQRVFDSNKRPKHAEMIAVIRGAVGELQTDLRKKVKEVKEVITMLEETSGRWKVKDGEPNLLASMIGGEVEKATESKRRIEAKIEACGLAVTYLDKCKFDKEIPRPSTVTFGGMTLNLNVSGFNLGDFR